MLVVWLVGCASCDILLLWFGDLSVVGCWCIGFVCCLVCGSWYFGGVGIGCLVGGLGLQIATGVVDFCLVGWFNSVVYI